MTCYPWWGARGTDAEISAQVRAMGIKAVLVNQVGARGEAAVDCKRFRE